MTSAIKWVVVGVLMAGVFVIAEFKPPQEIYQALAAIADRLTGLSLAMHLAAWLALAAGLFLPRYRTHLFAGLMALLAGSATVIGVVNLLPPNAVVFGLYLVLILAAWRRGQLAWDFSALGIPDRLFGVIGLVFGLWYLH